MSHFKLYEIRGAQYYQQLGLTSFCLYAPNARNVWVILTAYGSEQKRIEMIRTDDGIWEAVTDQARPGRTYLYLVHDCHGKQMLRTDPVSFSVTHIPEVDQIHSIVHDETVYQWNDRQWIEKRRRTNPMKSPLSIYEIQVKSWLSSTRHSLQYRQIADELVKYCQRMGFTHVEMYGILEHTGEREYGYQIANFFAPYRHNGRCDDFKTTSVLFSIGCQLIIIIIINIKIIRFHCTITTEPICTRVVHRHGVHYISILIKKKLGNCYLRVRCITSIDFTSTGYGSMPLAE